MQYDDYLYYEQVDEDLDGTYDYIELTDCEVSAISVEVPTEIDELPVKSIGDYAFYNCTSLESVTSIGGWHFMALTNYYRLQFLHQLKQLVKRL